MNVPLTNHIRETSPHTALESSLSDGPMLI